LISSFYLPLSIPAGLAAIKTVDQSDCCFNPTVSECITDLTMAQHMQVILSLYFAAQYRSHD